MTYNFADAATMSAYASGAKQLPTGWKKYHNCVFQAQVNDTAGTFTCPDSLKVVSVCTSLSGLSVLSHKCVRSAVVMRAHQT